jgi:ion channel
MIPAMTMAREARAARRGGLRILLASLMLLVVLSPFLTGGLLARTVFLVIATSILLSGAYASSSDPRSVAIALLLAMPTAVTNCADLFAPTPMTHLASRIALLAFDSYVLLLVLRLVLRTSAITTDEIYGALSVYVLIGVVWGIAYQLLELAEPASFHRSLEAAEIDLIYYSFVTLTTVGYGDITPVSPMARSLTVLEALVGVVYMAVFISRLVGMHAQSRSRA